MKFAISPSLSAGAAAVGDDGRNAPHRHDVADAPSLTPSRQ